MSLPINALESTGVGGGARSGRGAKSGWRVSKARHTLHMPDT